MSRLYWRIFISFWGVLLLTVIVTVAASRLILNDDVVNSRMETLTASMDALTEQAQRMLNSEGEKGLKRWLQEKEANLRVPMLIMTPGGKELLGRSVPRGLRAMLARARVESKSDGHRESHFVPQPRILSSERGDYVLVARRFGPDSSGGPWILQQEMRGVFPLALVLVSGLACFLLARYFMRPVQVLREVGQRIAAGDLSARVGSPVDRRKDEFGKLAQDFDRMADQVEKLLYSRERLLRDVSHELRSPLARLQAATGLLRQQVGESPAPNLDRIERETNTLNDMIGQILTFTRLQNMEQAVRESVDIVELTKAVTDNAHFEAQSKGSEVTLSAPAHLEVAIDPQLIQSAIENVVRNALQHSAKCTQITVEAAEQFVRIVVTDDGPGAPEENLSKLFDAFYTVAPSNSSAGKGAGIGLAIAYRALELHGGSISAVNSQTGKGLEVQLAIPLSAASATI